MTTPRLLTPADATAFFNLRQAALADSPWAFLASPGDDIASGPTAVATLLSEDQNDILGVFDDAGGARLIAAAGVNRDRHLKTRHRACIWGVFCDPAYRGRGLGRAVVAAAIDHARTWPGVDMLWLSASTPSVAALALYESLGFERWGVEPDSIRIDDAAYDEVHFTLRL